MEDFIGWLLEELNTRGWSQAELARRADVSPAQVSRVLSQTQQPGPETCTGIACALGLPPETVFRRAGLLPPQPEETDEEDAMIAAFRSLPKEDRDAILRFVRARALESLRTRR